MNSNNSSLAVNKIIKLSNGDCEIEIASCLSIFIITYNRKEPLRETLEMLKASPWLYCKITILDNCSTDDTSTMVAEVEPNFPNLNYLCNVTNIGLGANAIQPFLMSHTPYTWVLCDDDYLDFSHIEDVVEALRLQHAKLILVGGHPDEERFGSGQLATPQELMKVGVNYYRDNSFLPSTIYATEFARNHLAACYSFCNFNYPHVALALTAVQEALPVYVSRHRFVTPSIGTQSYSRREQMVWWYRLACTVPDQAERKRLLTSQWQGPLDPTGLYGIFNTALRLRLYNIALQLVFIFKGQVLSSFATMVRARMQGVRCEK